MECATVIHKAILSDLEGLDLLGAELSESFACLEVRNMQTSAPEDSEQIILNDTEKTILQTVRRDKLTGPQIADKSGFPYEKDLKAKLSELRKRNILDNKQGQGYFIKPEYYYLLDGLD